MTALVDFLLAPNGLRESLTNYLANDGSRIGEAQRERRELTQQGQFMRGVYVR